MGRALDDAIAALNGVVGDYLQRTDNGLATEMGFYCNGEPLELSPEAIARAYPQRSARLAVLVHGLACNENVWRMPDGTDYGSRLATDLGFTPLYLRYNSGLPIADNGANFSKLLDALVQSYPEPVRELLPIGYSMGGLVLRSACHFGSERGSAFLPLIERAIYVGTPHLGAPGERLGRIVARVLGAIEDPYTKLIADLGNLRSAGVKDLGDADLRAEDRATQSSRLSLRDAAHPVPLLPSIAHYLIAASLNDTPFFGPWIGDSVVPTSSATMHSSELPSERIKVLPGLSHVDVAHSPQVYAQILAFARDPRTE
jgi:triacylglycerol lipase